MYKREGLLKLSNRRRKARNNWPRTDKISIKAEENNDIYILLGFPCMYRNIVTADLIYSFNTLLYKVPSLLAFFSENKRRTRSGYLTSFDLWFWKGNDNKIQIPREQDRNYWYKNTSFDTRIIKDSAKVFALRICMGTVYVCMQIR